MHEMKFHVATPPADLTPWVMRIVERVDEAPMGMALELPLPFPSLHFLLGHGYGLRALGSAETFVSVPRDGLWGATDSASHGYHDGCMHAFVVVLTLRGAAAITRGAPRAFVGQRATLDAVLPPNSRHIYARLEGAGCFAERLDIVSVWLRGLCLRIGGMEAVTLTIADRILRGEIRGATPAVAEQAGVCLRTLRKRFERTVGQSPKQLLRVARLQRTLKQLHPEPWSGSIGSSGLNQDDARLEYFDDSHFARDFKMLTSISPQAYRQSKLRSGDPLVNTVY